MALTVIGAGLGRTGTMSLKHALEQLGLGRCCHMIELRDLPDRMALWDRVTQGQSVDWDEVFEGFGATVDWPACNYYRALADHYPQAKVILTVRDPDAWFDSTQATIFNGIEHVAAQTDKPAARVVKNTALKLFDGKMHDRGHCIGVYRRHNEEVRRTIPPHRLLELDVAQGWQPLCAFLGVPVPTTDFPRANSTQEVREMRARRETGLPWKD